MDARLLFSQLSESTRNMIFWFYMAEDFMVTDEAISDFILFLTSGGEL